MKRAYFKDRFEYELATDGYLCPEGHRLSSADQDVMKAERTCVYTGPLEPYAGHVRPSESVPRTGGGAGPYGLGLMTLYCVGTGSGWPQTRPGSCTPGARS